MAEAKNSKLKEYGTDLISHPDRFEQQPRNIRFNNTFKSNVLDQGNNDERYFPKSRDRLFKANPLTSQIQRTSYQDSNIFGYKEDNNLTVQQACASPDKDQRVRQNPTFSSRVFPGEQGGDQERPMSKQRNEEKWNSSVFGPPITESPKRKKLGAKDSGTEKLFGEDRVDYGNVSNHMPVIGQRKQNKYQPVLKTKTAEQRKQEELHGRSLVKFGQGKKGDSKNMYEGDRPQTAQSSGNDANSKKHQNLQSTLSLGEQAQHDFTAVKLEKEERIVQTGDKVVNKGNKVDTFKKRQQQLSSSVFEQTDYSHHVPMKKKQMDINNVNDKQRQNDHTYSDILGNTAKPKTQGRAKPAKTNEKKQSNVGQSNWEAPDLNKTPIAHKTQKIENLKSALDTHEYVAPPKPIETPQKLSFNANCRSTLQTKCRDLSSDILGVGSDIQKHFDANKDQNQVVDLQLSNLPNHVDELTIKKQAGVKHVISTQLDVDSITNNCTGTGRVKLRISPQENLQQVIMNYQNQGYNIKEYEENTKKKAAFTAEQTLSVKSPVKTENNAKSQKQSNLLSSGNDLFGNTIYE